MQSGQFIEKLNKLLERHGSNYSEFENLIPRVEKRSLIAILKRYLENSQIMVRSSTIESVAQELTIQLELEVEKSVRELGGILRSHKKNSHSSFMKIADRFTYNTVQNKAKLDTILGENELKTYVVSTRPKFNDEKHPVSETPLLVRDLVIENHAGELKFKFGHLFRKLITARHKTIPAANYPPFEGVTSMFENNLFCIGVCSDFEEVLPITLNLFNVRPRASIFFGFMTGSFAYNEKVYSAKICLLKTQNFEKDKIGFMKRDVFGKEIYNWLNAGQSFYNYLEPENEIFYDRQLI